MFDFSEKSNLQPNKILNFIPNNLHSYFYLGLFDGDGCFYIKSNTMQFVYASTYNQNYTFIENLFNLLNIRKYAIKRSVSKKNHKSSCIRITNHDDISKLIYFLYQDNIYDIGLKRKYDKAQLILNNKPKNQHIRLDKNKILDNINLKVDEMSSILGCSIYHCYRLKREYLKTII